jgi:chromosome segregation ATPase
MNTMQYMLDTLKVLKQRVDQERASYSGKIIALEEKIDHLEFEASVADKNVIKLKEKLNATSNLLFESTKSLEESKMQIQKLQEQLTIKDGIITHLTTALQQRPIDHSERKETEKTRLRRQRQNRFSNQRKKNRKNREMALTLNKYQQGSEQTYNNEQMLGRSYHSGQTSRFSADSSSDNTFDPIRK